MSSGCSFGFPKDEWRWWCQVKTMEEDAAAQEAATDDNPEPKRFRTSPDINGLNSNESSSFSLSQTTDILNTCEGSYLSQQSQNKTEDLPSSMNSPPFSSDPLGDLKPLGLTLRKSQSLVDLIQKNLEENDKSSNPEDSIEDRIKNKGNITVDSQHDKMKASNFPACYLKIGKWERTSVYEGDLVAKCYYAKRKLVWEVLDNGLKSKIEIQWSDITGLKANMPEKGPATLHVEISRTPMFFKETNPQPRKHTLWQSTSDFTGGQASICRRHLLQFTEGILNKHFEKLVQCDARLKSLSEQSVPFSGPPFFEGRILMLDLQQNTQILYPADIAPAATYGTFQSKITLPFSHNGPPVLKQSIVSSMELPGQTESVKLRTLSPSSVIDSRTNEESSNSDPEEQFAQEFGRHAIYKKTGTSILFDHRLWSSDKSTSSTVDQNSTNFKSANMTSCVEFPAGKGCKSVELHEENISDPKQNMLQRLSHHLLDEGITEKLMPGCEIKFFSETLSQNAEAKASQRNLLRTDLSDDVPSHTYSEGPFSYGMDSIRYPIGIKENRKTDEFNFKAVKMENYIPSRGTIFSLAGNPVLDTGPDLNRHEFFQGTHGVPQAPRFF